MRDDCGNFVLVGKIGQIVCKLLCCGLPASHAHGCAPARRLQYSRDVADRVGAQVPPSMMVFAACVRDACGYKAHDFVSCTDTAGRGKTAGNDLAEDGNICRNAEGGLRTAHAKTEAGNDFVHNQQDTVLVTHSSRTF